MNKKSTIMSAMILSLLLVGNASAATSAQGQSDSNRAAVPSQTTTESGTSTTNAKQKFTEQKCKSIQSRINTKIEGYNKVNNRNYNAFLNMQARLSKVEARLRLEEGLDTTKLNQDIKVLNELISDYSKDYTTLNSELKFTNKKACENTQGEFQNELNKAREQVKLVHQNREKIRAHYANFIKPDLIALKKQIEDEEDGANAAADGTETTDTGDTSVSNNQ